MSIGVVAVSRGKAASFAWPPARRLVRWT